MSLKANPNGTLSSNKNGSLSRECCCTATGECPTNCDACGETATASYTYTTPGSVVYEFDVPLTRIGCTWSGDQASEDEAFHAHVSIECVDGLWTATRTFNILETTDVSFDTTPANGTCFASGLTWDEQTDPSGRFSDLVVTIP